MPRAPHKPTTRTALPRCTAPALIRRRCSAKATPRELIRRLGSEIKRRSLHYSEYVNLTGFVREENSRGLRIGRALILSSSASVIAPRSLSLPLSPSRSLPLSVYLSCYGASKRRTNCARTCEHLRAREVQRLRRRRRE